MKHPETELKEVLDIYEEVKDDDISGLNLLDVIDLVGQLTFGDMKDHPEYIVTIRKWLIKNPTPEMLKRQSS